ncbi:MAG TPA: hypothetical protein VGR78_15775 [Verrucomicrobiae bacterium]|jgi:hypothetical protein|nr:hypothetical protein [Verrucomicrobiae bacterium]
MTAFVLAVSAPSILRAQSIEERLRALENQNDALRQQLADQKRVIDDLQSRVGNGSTAPAAESGEKANTGFNFGRVHLGAEGGVAFFAADKQGQYPSSTFRVDEAKLFLESPVWNNTYFYSELDVVTREAPDENFHLGELYIDFENVLRRWTDHNWLSLRVGRMYTPFGEEYNARYVIDNPLISHSLSDVWGVDEGVEIYGNGYGFDYAVALQNGGIPSLKDFTGDKSIAGRIGYNFGKHVRLSFSGMRTGDVSTSDDMLSALWFGNGFFRAMDPAATKFQANLYELDAQTFWKSGHLKLAGGYFDYSDNNPTTDRSRDGWYYYAEALQNLPKKFYAASRFSQVLSDKGMPIVGLGDFGEYFFGPLTRDLWRLSLGVGYRWSENLVAKLEYTLEQGSTVGGTERIDHNFFGMELGFKF